MKAIKFVDKVIPKENWEQKIQNIKDNDIDRTKGVFTTDVKHVIKNGKSL